MESNQLTVLSNIQVLYDGKSDTPSSLKSQVNVYIKDGLIEEIRPFDAPALGGSSNRILDCTGLTVAPGLIDCHSHITLNGTSPAELNLTNGPAGFLLAERALYKTLCRGGVTSLRDLGGATNLLKQLVASNFIIGPRMKIAIAMLSSTGGHADYRGTDRCHSDTSSLFKEANGRPSSVVDGVDECIKRVRELDACGADIIKVCSGHSIGKKRQRSDLPRDLTFNELKAICTEASHRGLRVAAHAHSKEGISEAIRAGVHDLQHITFLGDEEIELAVKNGCTVTPTAWALQQICRNEATKNLLVQDADQIIQQHAEAVRKAAKAGIKILVGSDPVFPHMHGRNFMELKALMDCGLPYLKVWHGSTGLAASELLLEDTGTIEKGKRADLIVSKTGSLEKPSELEAGLLEVIKDGVPYRGYFSNWKPRSFVDCLDMKI